MYARRGVQVSRGDYKARYPRLADEDLMVLVGGGNADAFAALYDRHFRSAYSLAYKLTGEKQAAEDLTQDAFLKIWRSAKRYRAQRGSVRTWILSVVRNQGIDQLRVRSSRRRTQEKVEASAPRYESSEAFAQVWHEARLGRVREALDALPHVQQQVLELAHFSDLTHMEIAERLRLPLGTVKGRMRLGLGKLRNNPEVRDVAAG
ncbi:MAG: sigma-70 family RNA polymerase sigma factor [Rubrobacteraceae bacterium]|jgi:RNA polymerase sigma-70 factor (ECF subfamily)|nr:sigma-70 family RNA polymerase sigma factor [Rubrobacteraceae bacterium]